MSVIELVGEDVNLVQQMIGFLYSYEDRVWPPCCQLPFPAVRRVEPEVGIVGAPKLLHPFDDPVTAYLGLYGLATRYGIAGLRKRQLEGMFYSISRELMDYDMLEEILVQKASAQILFEKEDKRWDRVLKSCREFR